MSASATSDIPARLGKPLRVYTSNRRAVPILVAFPIVLVGLIIGVASLAGSAPIGAVVGLAIIGGGVYAGYTKTEGNGWNVTLCENGISSRDKRRTARSDLAAPRDISWDEIVSVRCSITRFVRGVMSETFEFYILKLQDGSTFDLTSALKRIRELGQTVQDEVFKRVSPQITEAYNAGQEVNFEALGTRSDGLRVREQWIPWGQLADVSLQQGVLTIRQHGASAATPVQVEASEVSNLPILLSILQQVVGPQRVH